MLPQTRKAAKLTRKEDRLTQLPNAMLHLIISKLTLKEAVITSLLSKSWRCIWTSHPNLLFDPSNTLPTSFYSSPLSNKQFQRRKFLELVDDIMRKHFMGSTKIDSLTVCFNLDNDCASHINEWIRLAVLKGVEEVNLDLSEWSSFNVNHDTPPSYQPYIFCSSILSTCQKDCAVKYLQLQSCTLCVFPCSIHLNSLITVVIRDVNMSDQELESFLMICPSLERLSLYNCKDLVAVNLVGPTLRLKFLNVQNCLRVESISICAEHLVKLDYTGHSVRFTFKGVPRLTQVFLNFTGRIRVDGVDYALSRLGYDLPHLETINLVSILSLKTVKLPETVPAFTNVKHFVLTIFPFEDEDKLCWISYILKAFPLLQKLELNLFSPGYIKKCKEVNSGTDVYECCHEHLREVEVNGFYGNGHERELVGYLVDNLVGLQVLVVNTRQKLYKGFNNWEYEEVGSMYKLSKESVDWLREAAPCTVDLRII